jgi:Cof subfamily protein (haloacid dehalogenase superfamily)
MIKLLLCDIDGTLVRPDKSLGPPVVDAVARLQAVGVCVSIISARPMSGMLWIAERLNLTHPMAAFNGATIFDADGKITRADHLGEAEAARALALLAEHKVEPWAFANGRWYATTGEGEHAARERCSAGIEPTVQADLIALTRRVDKIVGVSDNYAMLEALKPEMIAAMAGRATVARSQLYYLDVTPLSGNKGDGVAAIARECGVPLEQVAVIGDQRNDLAMFARAGLSVAMGNGPEDVRAAAQFTTTGNDVDGVAHAIDTIILPRIAR